MTATEQLRATPAVPLQVGIVHIGVGDPDRAFHFYSDLLDWESDPYRGEGFSSHYITNTGLLTVLTNDPAVPAVRLWFAVDDLPTALELVTSLGGGIEASELADDGGWARINDGQGIPLGLWRRRGDHQGPPPTKAPKGEIGYVTLHVADSARAVAFYEALLGWRFQEPRGADYHHVDNIDLSLGLYGGHREPHVEWYVAVGDIAPLVPRVAELGGRAGQITESRSGLSATCADDRGNTFRLWQPAAGYSADQHQLDPVVSQATRDEPMTDPTRTIHRVETYLSVSDPRAAIDFYQRAFGATFLGEPVIMPDGSIGHSELLIGDSVVRVAGEHSPEDVRSPASLGGTTVQLFMIVNDADAVFARAVEAGASTLRPVTDAHGTRIGKLRDPFGHNWFVVTATDRNS